MFFNTPARRKFLKAESTELAHVTALVTHYALAHPDKHFELHSATHALLVAPPVKKPAERIYQIFGNDTLEQMRGKPILIGETGWPSEGRQRQGARPSVTPSVQ